MSIHKGEGKSLLYFDTCYFDFGASYDHSSSSHGKVTAVIGSIMVVDALT